MRLRPPLLLVILQRDSHAFAPFCSIQDTSYLVQAYLLQGLRMQSRVEVITI